MLQSNQVLSFFRPRKNGGDWSQRELAEFYRVEDALVGSGISIATDRGLTDEGEPWFVFYRQDNEEVIVHFARIDDEFVVASNLTDGVARGRNFELLVRELLESHPYVLPKSGSRRQTVYLHPAALLAALVVTGYVQSAELTGSSDDQGRTEKGFGWVFNRHDLVAYSAIVIAAVWDTLTSDSPVHKASDFVSLDEAQVEHNVADLSVPFQSIDGQNVLDDLVSKNAQDHSLLAATTVNFEHQAITETAGNSWSFANSEFKGAVNQTPAHPAESDLPISTHDISRLEKDGDGKFATWHPEQEQAELLQGSQQLAHVTVAKIGSSTAPSEVPITSETHKSPTSLTAVSGTSPAAVDVIDAQNIISSALHVDPQSLHPVVLSAATLADAIRTALPELNQNPTSGTAAGVSGSLTTASTDSSSATSSVSGSLTTTSTNSSVSSANSIFDDAAKVILDEFIHDTPQMQVEVAGKDFILVDMDRSHYGSGQQVLETWTMSDGSTLSIIGIVPHHDALLAAA